MTKRVWLVLLIGIFFVLPVQGQEAKGDSYPVTVHVSRSEVVFITDNNSPSPYERIEATIEGRHYTLIGTRFANTKFSLGIKPAAMKTGDYKARLVDEKTVNAALYYRQYEFLFADGSKLKFDVIGESE